MWLFICDVSAPFHDMGKKNNLISVSSVISDKSEKVNRDNFSCMFSYSTTVQTGPIQGSNGHMSSLRQHEHVTHGGDGQLRSSIWMTTNQRDFRSEPVFQRAR